MRCLHIFMMYNCSVEPDLRGGRAATVGASGGQIQLWGHAQGHRLENNDWKSGAHVKDVEGKWNDWEENPRSNCALM